VLTSPSANDLFFDTAVPLPLVRAASIKAYAVTSDRRSAVSPDTPTFAEMGMPGAFLSGITLGYEMKAARAPSTFATFRHGAGLDLGGSGVAESHTAILVSIS
jgi:hypothetical protein